MTFLTSFDDVLLSYAGPGRAFDGIHDDDGEYEQASLPLSDDEYGEISAAVRATGLTMPPDDDSFEYIPLPDAEWLDVSLNGLVCVDRPNREVIPLSGTDETVFYDSYVVADSLDIQGLTVEAVGVMYASALLGAEGRATILSLGGPGRPDLLSLDAERNLWITEVKATQKGGLGLHETHLLRSLANAEGGASQLFENSASWLQRSGVNVLRSIDIAMQRATGAAEAEGLGILKDRYTEAVRSGFSAGGFKSEVIQVGLIGPEADYLLPLTVANSGVTDRFLEEVRPDRIVQMNVAEGAHQADAEVRADDDVTGGDMRDASDVHQNDSVPSAEAAGSSDATDDGDADE